MNARLSRPPYTALLTLLMAGLFISVYLLNREQYIASCNNIGASFDYTLKHLAGNLAEDLERQEMQYFTLTGDDRLLKASFFFVSESQVVPACVSNLLTHLPNAVAEQAYQEGIQALPDKTALPHFKLAVKLKADTHERLYQKISSHFNVLELDYDIETVCCILSLINRTDGLLTQPQSTFFRSMLEEQVQNLEEIQHRLSSLYLRAEEISQILNLQKGSFRVPFQEQVLSIRNDGLALLYTPRLRESPPYEIMTKPEGLHRTIVPGYYLTVPDAIIADQMEKIRKRHRNNMAIWGLMALLGSILIFGMIASTTRLRNLDAMRTEFIATVSHELRTPLSLIRLHAETLSHGRVPNGKVETYHQTILTEAERLTGIVNNVLDFSRMERDKLKLHLEPTDLSALTEHIAETFHERLQQEGIALERNIAAGVAGAVDPIAYSQVVFNLLDNAIKYSNGTKTIQIELDVSNGWNILRVVDQGIGISDKLKKRVFKEFVRSDDRRVTARRGSGIGLSVAKRLVEKMNGTIEVADNQPNGSIFTVRVPPASSGLQGRQDGGDTKGSNETISG